MKSSGGTNVPSAVHQRASASTPTTRRVASSKIGWYSTKISSFATPAASARTILRRASSASRAALSYAACLVTAAFACISAISASRTRRSGSALASRVSASPTRISNGTLCPSRVIGCELIVIAALDNSAAASSSATCWATTNSSAPIRATVPLWLLIDSRRAPTSRNSASPTSWPNSSFTAFNSVMSQHRTATMRFSPCVKSRLSRSCKSAQFGNPVIASRSACSRSRSSIAARLNAALSTRPTPRINPGSFSSRRP